MTATYFERRYQVFISSTYTDLREERRSVMQAVLEMDCFPAGMELFPAADETAWEYIRKIIQESDYYILVVGARYGSRDDNGLGFTEREYAYAVELGKPVLAFLHADPSAIPVGKADLGDADRLALEAFRSKVKRKLCDHWSSSAELQAKVLASLNRLKKSHSNGGWVRAGEVPAAQLELELERTKRELAETRTELQALQNAGSRADRALPSAKGWGDPTKLDVELIGDDDEPSASVVQTTWDAIFTCIGPRMAESKVTPNVWRNRLSKFAAEQLSLSDDVKAVVPQREADRIAWQLRALGVMVLDSGYWELTEEGWTALDQLFVEEVESDDPDEQTEDAYPRCS